MNDYTRKPASGATMPLRQKSLQADEARLVGEHVHPAVGDDWRDVYRRAEIELRLHLAAGRIDADEFASVGSNPEPAAG